MNMHTVTAIQLILSSTAFQHNGWIPKQYTCDSKNVNPPLHIEEIPANTKSLVLIIEDPDAPAGTWNHWIVWNIPPQEDIKENSVPGREAINSYGQRGYKGPCPPSGTHRYFFKVYALDVLLNINDNTSKKELETAMKNHVLAYGEIIGLYKRD